MLKRKEYRKKYNAAGQLYIGGETLRLNCYDVSVKGAMVEIIPGKFLCTADDFNELLVEGNVAEIFIDDLLMTGEAVICWVKKNRDRIMLGVEFHNVIHNADKIWRKRRCYRKKQPFSAELFVDKDRLNVEGINCSIEGACLCLEVNHPGIKVGALVKLAVKEFAFNALGKVVWIRHDAETVTAGLQIIAI